MKVVWTRPVLVLSQIKRLNILKTLFSELFVPGAVFTEYIAKALGTENERKLTEANIKITEVKDLFAVMTLRTDFELQTF